MKKLIALLAVVFVGISLSACQSSGSGSDASNPASKTVATSAPTKEAPVSLDGTWKADGFTATIASNSIEIHIVSTDSESLYWKGTFPSGIDKITSIADTEALSMSLLGSQDSEKVFSIDGNKITFKMSMMGTTKTVKLKKA